VFGRFVTDKAQRIRVSADAAAPPGSDHLDMETVTTYGREAA